MQADAIGTSMRSPRSIYVNSALFAASRTAILNIFGSILQAM